MQVEPDSAEDWTRPGVYEVVPGVYRIPLPLPTDGLKAVNVYALTGVGGPVLIDSGWAITEARETLDAALDTLGHTVADVRRFLVTHIHRDHYQMAVAVRREFGNQVSLGAGEEPAITLLSEPMRRPMSGRVEEMRRYGATELVAWLLSRMDQMHHDPAAWAPPDDWLRGRAYVLEITRALESAEAAQHEKEMSA